jgi:hypothetical protein
MLVVQTGKGRKTRGNKRFEFLTAVLLRIRFHKMWCCVCLSVCGWVTRRFGEMQCLLFIGKAVFSPSTAWLLKVKTLRLFEKFRTNHRKTQPDILTELKCTYTHIHECGMSVLVLATDLTYKHLCTASPWFWINSVLEQTLPCTFSVQYLLEKHLADCARDAYGNVRWSQKTARF